MRPVGLEPIYLPIMSRTLIPLKLEARYLVDSADLSRKTSKTALQGVRNQALVPYITDQYPLPLSRYAHRCEPAIALCGAGRGYYYVSIEQAPVLIRSSIFCAIG